MLNLVEFFSLKCLTCGLLCRADKYEKLQARIALYPVLQAEEDRRSVSQLSATVVLVLFSYCVFFFERYRFDESVHRNADGSRQRRRRMNWRQRS